MKDNEIIKALECCVSGHCISDGCPIYDEAEHGSVEKCLSVLAHSALDLINRQKAEIAELQKELDIWTDIAHRETLYAEQAKSEVIKEFAERLKELMFIEDFLLAEPCDMAKTIDNLVKEMMEVSGNA